MKALLASILILATAASVIAVDEEQEDCMVTNPIGNTIVTAGEKMKIAWVNSHASKFETITLIQTDGNNAQPIIIAENVDTSLGKITIQLPRALIPSNAYYMTLGTAPYHCKSGNLRILGANTEIPDSSPPPALTTQISSGRFPTSTETESSAVPLVPALLLVGILLASFMFTLA